MNLESIFEDSIYYPPAGTDVQALLRLAPLGSSILAPSVSHFLSPERIEAQLRQKLDFLNGSFGREILTLEGVENLDHLILSQPLYVPDPGILHQNEQKGYMQSFQQYMKGGLYLRRFRFRIQGLQEHRILDWYALSTEGLATLVALHRMFGCLPRTVVSIQSGTMEREESPMLRLFERLGEFPDVWVRGEWSYTHGHSPCTVPMEPFTATLQSYGHWNSRLGTDKVKYEENPHPGSLSRVRAFGQPGSQERLKNDGALESGLYERSIGHRLRLIQGDVQSSLPDCDLLFTSQRVMRTLQIPEDTEVLTYESLAVHDNPSLPPLSFAQAMQKVAQIAQSKNANRVVMTPVGFECETMDLANVHDLIAPDSQWTIHYRDPLDFIDWQKPGQSQLSGPSAM